jgi:HPt (histidine-containing phosphotransfer) domain-containing protein
LPQERDVRAGQTSTIAGAVLLLGPFERELVAQLTAQGLEVELAATAWQASEALERGARRFEVALVSSALDREEALAFIDESSDRPAPLPLIWIGDAPPPQLGLALPAGQPHELAAAVAALLARARRPSAVEELEALRREYRAGLPGHLEQVREALLALARPGTPGGVSEALARVHRLAGTAGSYGLTALGDALRAIELELRAAQETGRAPDAGAMLRSLERAERALPGPQVD